jgi:hypothetical protein
VRVDYLLPHVDRRSREGNANVSMKRYWGFLWADSMMYTLELLNVMCLLQCVCPKAVYPICKDEEPVNTGLGRTVGKALLV